MLLITDLNSRIPVTLEGSRAHAILTGTNGTRPRLIYWPEGVPPREGERIVTSAEANAYPANLPIGTVHYSASGAAEVEPLPCCRGWKWCASSTTALNAVTAPDPTSQRPPVGSH